MEVVLTKENFESEVLNSQIPVLVDFWATWCGPCRMLSPVIEDLAKELDGKVKIGKVNIDEQLGLAIKYRVEVIPTLILFNNGEVQKRNTGFLTKEEVKQVFAL
jgi:thioredoxin 1